MNMQQVLCLASRASVIFGVWIGISALAPLLSAQEPASGVDLDRLLRLPDSFEAGGERIGGASEAEWRTRFRDASRALEDARQSLASTQQELGTLAEDSSQYQVSAPGIDIKPDESPMSFRLRQAIRRRRTEVEERQRELRDLEIKANLAGVPPSWRHPPVEGE